MPIFNEPADRGAIVTVASQLWGEPNKALSSRDEMRFGTNGSKSVKPALGVWYDHEADEGGGFRDLYRLANGQYPENGTDKSGFPVPAGMLRELGQPVAWWDYHNEAGAVVARVVRFEPPGADKTFRQCRPQGPGWVWKMDGLQIPLYRLPSLVRAPKGSVVYLPEGEKKADQLRQWGLVATSSAGGSKKFRADHAHALAGHTVIVLPDNDKAGRDHRDIVTRHLRAAGVQHHVLNLPGLPEKGDVVNWIKAGGTADEFARLTDALLRDHLPAAELPTKLGKFAPISLADCQVDYAARYIIKGLLNERQMMLVIGQPGAAKSVLMPYLAHAIAGERTVFGRRVRQGRVLYIAAEAGPDMEVRFVALRQRYGLVDGLSLIAQPIDLQTDGSQDFELLRREIVRFKPDVIGLDTLAAAFPGLRENDPDDMGRAARIMRALGAPDEAAGFKGASIIAAHHQPKDGSTPRGHSNLNGDADIVLMIEGKDDETRTVTASKNRNGPSGYQFSLNVELEELGVDADGDTMRRPVAIEAEASAAAAGKGKVHDEAVTLLREIENSLACGEGRRDSPEPGMPLCSTINRKILQRTLIRKGWLRLPENSPTGSEAGSVPDAEHKRLWQRLNHLRVKGIIGFNANDAWLVKPPATL